MSLTKEIQLGEGKKLEFKVEMPGADKIMKTAVAFSNNGGGKLIIGVSDDGEVVGVTDEDIFELPDRLVNIIYDGCYPTILPEIYTEAIEEKNVLVMEFYPGNAKPYYLKSKKKNNGTYVRIGATNKLADESLIFELERQRRNISLDEETAYEVELDTLNLHKLKEDFRRLTNKSLEEAHLINMKLIKEESGELRPSNGLLLLTAQTQTFEYARIKCARFKGTTISEFIDQKEFVGPLYEQVENGMNFAKQYIAKSGIITELQRKETYEIPIVAIREALVNAVVHRDYSLVGADIKLAIFDDRLEITSPGSLPKSLDIEAIKEGRSEVRNRVIARFFKEVKYIEQWGTGIRRIMLECANQGLIEPEFKESGNFFKVVIYKKKKKKNDGKATASDGKATISGGKEQVILEYMEMYQTIATRQVRELTGLKDTAAKKILKNMVEKELIVPSGSGKYRHYVLKQHQ